MYKIKVTDLDCKICRKMFKNHRALSGHVKMHKITSKDYYDIYYKQYDQNIYCKYCGKETPYINITNGYREYCCRKCADLDELKREKTEQTHIERFGVKCVLKLENVHKKGVLKSQSDEIIKKRKQTCIDKYGVDNPWKANSVIKKISKTKSITGNRSSLELYLETQLKNKNIDFEIEHRDERYPFNCDFYIPKNDLYIEINNWWFHNNHFFNKTNVQDIETLNVWKERAKTSNQYQRAIEVWTVEDVQKLKIATKNNLNYIVLWNKQDIDNFIQNI